MTHHLSLRAYAEHRRELGLSGTSHTAVRRAIKDGRIAKGAIRDGKEYQIDPEIADKEWLGTTRPQMQREEPKGGRPPTPEPAGQGSLFPPLDGPEDPDADGAAIAELSDFRKAADREQHFKALQRELDYRASAGQLLDAEGVRRTWFGCADALRRHLDNLRESLAPILALEQSEVVVQNLLAEEHTKALQKFLDELPAASRRSG